MTSVPLGEARAASIPTHGESRAADIPAVGSRSQVPLLADVPVSADQRDVDQASVQPATLEAVSESGDKDKHEAAAGSAQEPTEVLLAYLAPDVLQTSRGLQNLLQDGPLQDARMTQSPKSLQHTSPTEEEEETPQTAGISDMEPEPASSLPSVQVQPSQNAEAPPVVSAADANGQLDTLATGATEAVEEKPEGPEALDPDTDTAPSAPALPGCRQVALGRRRLDFMAREDNSYMRSVTSLLGGGEGPISSLADILVWSETTMGMTRGILASGHGSVTDLLRSTGPRLHPASSILGSPSPAFSSGLVVGTSSALRSITHMLELAERRTMEGIRLAVRYLTSHLTSRQAHTGPNLN